MCTVTFIPVKDKYYITSNRDEKSLRKQAVEPKRNIHNNRTIIYPKDAEAGGTWIAMNDNGNAAVLLNGAFVKHVSSPPYNKSRGLVFLELIAEDMPVRKFLNADFNNIEPFTIIFFNDGNLYECRWDGSKKYCTQKDAATPHIWSSATLYNEAVVKKREQWFAKWLSKNPDPSQQDILHFHQFAGDSDMQNNLLMNREGIMLTVSITSIELSQAKGTMHYVDLKDSMVYRQQLDFISCCEVV